MRRRGKQHAVLAGIFARASAAWHALQARRGDPSRVSDAALDDDLRVLLEKFGTEALFENEDWSTLRRDRPMVLPAGVARER